MQDDAKAAKRYAAEVHAVRSAAAKELEAARAQLLAQPESAKSRTETSAELTLKVLSGCGHTHQKLLCHRAF